MSCSDGIVCEVAELITRYGSARRTLDLHVADARGRCRACTAPGYGTPGLPWPCLLHIAATEAGGGGRR